METHIHHLPYAHLTPIHRGQGIVNLLIATADKGSKNIKSGITKLPVGAAVPRHSHNAEEQVTVLEGKVRFVLNDQVFDCLPYDSTFISSGVEHEFSNVGDMPALVMVVYGSSRVNRTFSSTGETVELGSEKDKFPPAESGAAAATA